MTAEDEDEGEWAAISASRVRWEWVLQLLSSMLIFYLSSQMCFVGVERENLKQREKEVKVIKTRREERRGDVRLA